MLLRAPLCTVHHSTVHHSTLLMEMEFHAVIPELGCTHGRTTLPKPGPLFWLPLPASLVFFPPGSLGLLLHLARGERT